MTTHNKRSPTLIEKLKSVTDFATDGCTMSPDLVFSHCCVEHDVDYATGEVTREEADRKLRQCIASTGYPVLCWVYWLAVRLFGWIPYYFGYNAELRIQWQEHKNKTEND